MAHKKPRKGDVIKKTQLKKFSRPFDFNKIDPKYLPMTSYYDPIINRIIREKETTNRQ